MAKHIENIIIGKPIVSPEILLGSGSKDSSYKEVTVYDEERFLPKLLAKYGIMSSASEVRRNRPDLVKELNALDCMELKIGKKRLYIVVGTKTEEEYNSYFK